MKLKSLICFQSQSERNENQSARKGMEVLRASESFKSHEFYCDPEEEEFTVITLMTYPPTDDDEDFNIPLLDPPAASDPLPDEPKISIDSFDCQPLPRPISNGVIPGICMICSLEDEHSSRHCPYLKYIPKNATASRCDIVCTICGSLYSGRCCNQDAGCAKLKLCHNCLRFGDHWASQCPEEDRSLIDVDF